jgi:hypothetical protein
MLPKLPRRIEILNVPLGRTQGSQGGFYAKADATVTAHLEGSDVGSFSIRNIQTKDVVTEQDGPHGPIEVLEFAQTVVGSGPIDVSAGADVGFLFEVRLDADGVSFGATIDGALSAAGDGPATRIGLRTLGYPAAGTFHRHGVFAAFAVPNLFQKAKSSSAQYRMIPAFGEPDAGNIPDPPDELETSTPAHSGH